MVVRVGVAVRPFELNFNIIIKYVEKYFTKKKNDKTSEQILIYNKI